MIILEVLILTVLDIKNLSVVFHTYAGVVQAVSDVSFSLKKGEILGLVGESGCGKSVTSSAIMGLVPKPPGETNGEIYFEGKNLVDLDTRSLQDIRGNSISMIFQDPMTSLNPVLTIGLQLSETLILHRGLSKDEALKKSIEILELVGISSPAVRMKQYPHQLSGGMRQRVMIAMALSCNPKILIADEPTTALDVTVQAQIIDLMKKLNHDFHTSIILISHDLGVIASLCQRVQVMYAGRIVESAPVDELYANACHPYTWGLMHSVPRADDTASELRTIGGQPPDLLVPPRGCAFEPRCKFSMGICREELPPLFEIKPEHQSRCWLNHELSSRTPQECFLREEEGSR